MKRRWGVVMVVAIASVGCGQLLGIDQLSDRTFDAANDVVIIDEAGIDASEACAPTRGVCNPFPQCGCLENENCEITTSFGDTTCSAIGVNALWDNCTGYGECPLGATCIAGVCKPFCNSAADCVGTNVTCEQIRIQSTGNPVPGLKVCSAGCDPMNPSAICGPDVMCGPAPWDGKGKDHGDCFGGAFSTAMGPDACSGVETAASCALGYYCLANHSCSKWCRVGHDEDCTTPETCLFFFTPVIIGGVQYGTCNP